MLVQMKGSQVGVFFCSPSGNLAESGVIFSLLTAGTVTCILWGDIRDVTKYPVTYRTAPHNKKLSSSKCHCSVKLRNFHVCYIFRPYLQFLLAVELCFSKFQLYETELDGNPK